MDIDVGALWAAAGVLVGFQVTALTLRINREIAVGGSGDLTWLPVADGLNLLSLSVTLVGVFILPVLDAIAVDTASELFGVAVLLLLGYAFALAGHYEMFNPKTGRSMDYLPFQEQVALVGVAIAVLAYIAVAVFA